MASDTPLMYGSVTLLVWVSSAIGTLVEKSHHPQAHKAAVVRTLMNRAKVLPSSVLARTDEEVQVTAALQSSGYPLRFIQNSSTPTTRVPIADETHTSSVTLPYIKGVSEAIRRVLAPLCVRTSFCLLYTSDAADE